MSEILSLRGKYYRIHDKQFDSVRVAEQLGTPRIATRESGEGNRIRRTRLRGGTIDVRELPCVVVVEYGDDDLNAYSLASFVVA